MTITVATVGVLLYYYLLQLQLCRIFIVIDIHAALSANYCRLHTPSTGIIVEVYDFLVEQGHVHFVFCVIYFLPNISGPCGIVNSHQPGTTITERCASFKQVDV